MILDGNSHLHEGVTITGKEMYVMDSELKTGIREKLHISEYYRNL